jgi:fatty-acyl-CoA synthase
MEFQPNKHIQQAGSAHVGRLFKSRAEAVPERIAVTDLQRSLTYTALNQRVNRLANHLCSDGILPGDRVALLARNCIEYIEVELACAKIGAIVAAQNWRLADRELAHCLNLVTPKIIIHEAELTANLDRLDLLPHARLSFGEAYETALANASTAEPDIQIDDEAGLIILYTSGTTGLPKGALISHRAMVARSFAYAVDLGVPADNNFVAWPPLFHMVSTDHALSTLMRGGRVIVVDGFQADRLITCLQRYQMHWFIVIPGMIEGFLAALKDADPVIKGVAMIGAMADLVPPQQLAAITTALNAPYLNSFGATETGLPPATGNLIPINTAPSRLSKQQSAGCEIRLVDGDDNEVPLGTPGELTLRGPTLFSGYWQAEQTNADDFRGGWFHLGDVFRRNGDGSLDFVDRVKYMIKSGGENIYPAEIEQVILADLRVADCAVIRQSDDRWGEVPIALVARQDPCLTVADLMQLCAAQLSRYKRPQAVIFIDQNDFPRSTSGKIQRHELEARMTAKKLNSQNKAT